MMHGNQNADNKVGGKNADLTFPVAFTEIATTWIHQNHTFDLPERRRYEQEHLY